MASTASVSIDIQVGGRIAHVRQKAGLTLQELADRLGWPVSTLHNYESGRRPLKLAQLQTIATVLGRSSAAFLVNSEEAAAVVEQIVRDEERCLQMILFLETLDADDASTSVTALSTGWLVGQPQARTDQDQARFTTSYARWVTTLRDACQSRTLSLAIMTTGARWKGGGPNKPDALGRGTPYLGSGRVLWHGQQVLSQLIQSPGLGLDRIDVFGW
jgi:transcriptional regulator with XRE-family HTH domain